ncbi:hypothetical protein SAMN04487895_101524 [Paenibacillus sophorae]|uniref:Uncharacterized protein n=1 Tax=Paenibacillus sophorae TaxID=1333845 RepID=A0A1H8GK18_9BACL|nr:hypothetical protein [Paenibacillus sophorae]QWU14234.1 hypothetical protein KP014_20195 [Paenibacillus sophorae]SEN43658.1 hypothetical protein SAMN04487895_101524 [Paenibacillus sophorae]
MTEYENLITQLGDFIYQRQELQDRQRVIGADICYIEDKIADINKELDKLEENGVYE